MKVFWPLAVDLVGAGAFRVADAGELTSFVVETVVKEGGLDGTASKSSS